jgi:PAS domain-containing protein
MRLSIKARQVAGVTSIVALVVLALSAIHLTSLGRVRLEDTQARAGMLANAIYQRTSQVVAEAEDAYGQLAGDAGLRSLLQSSIAYSRDVSYAAIVDPAGFAIVHSTPAEQGEPLPIQGDLTALLQRGRLAQLRAIYSDRTFELKLPLLLENERFGEIRIGVSMLLIREELQDALRPAALTALAALGIATIVAMVLSQWILRPIHVIRSGLSRLGRGEFGVTLDLPPGEEFKDLGTSFKAISEQLSSARNKSGPAPAADSVVQRLEDAVAMFDAAGRALFVNPAMRQELGVLSDARLDDWPASHPYRQVVEKTLATRAHYGPTNVPIPQPGDENARS